MKNISRILLFGILGVFVIISMLVSVTGVVSACKPTPTKTKAPPPPPAPTSAPLPPSPGGGGGSSKPVVPISDFCFTNAIIAVEPADGGSTHEHRLSNVPNNPHDVDITPNLVGLVYNPSVNPLNLCEYVDAYQKQADGQKDLYIQATSGGTRTQITNTPVDEDFPNWTIHHTIVYQYGPDQIWSMVDDGSSPHELFAGKDPLVSPDDGKIAFLNVTSGVLEYYMRSTGVTHVTTITPSLLVNWTHDGSMLLYRAADNHLHTFDFEAKTDTDLGLWSDAAPDPTVSGFAGLVVQNATLWWYKSPDLVQADMPDWKNKFPIKFDPAPSDAYVNGLPVATP